MPGHAQRSTGRAPSPVGGNRASEARKAHGRQDQQARAAARRSRDRFPRGSCHHVPGSGASDTGSDTPSAAAVERVLRARRHGVAGAQARRLRARSTPAQRMASRRRRRTFRWAIRWAKPSRIGPYQTVATGSPSLGYVEYMQAFSRSMPPRTPCFTRERSQVRNPPRPSETCNRSVAGSRERGERIATGVGGEQFGEEVEQRAVLLAAGRGGGERALGESLAIV